MAREVDIKALISHIITGDGLDRCRLCMGDTSDGQVFLEDTILIEDNKPVSLGELLESITGVEVETSKLLPKSLCKVCTNEACMAALYIQQIKTNNDKINNTLKQLSSLQKEKAAVKTIFATIHNETIEIHHYRNETRTLKDASLKLKKRATLLKARNKRLQKIEKLKACGIETSKECSAGMLKKKYNDKNLKCPICSKKFLEMYQLLLHFEHGSSRLCWFCYEVISFDNFQNHLQCHGSLATYFKCSKCYDAFMSQKKLNSHAKKYHSGPDNLTCHICKYSYKNSRVLLSHMSKHEGEKCPKCGLNFNNRKCAYHHAKSCKEIEKCICDFCHREFDSKRKIRRHIAELHLRLIKLQYQCTECKKRFRIRSHLVEHSYTHSRKRDRFSCDICQSTFMSRRGHEKHYKKHLGTVTEINIINIEDAGDTEFLPDVIEFA